MPHITSRNEIRAVLETDREWAVYALGDLATGLFEQCEWFCASDKPALVLLFRGFGTPVLFALGAPSAVEILLSEIAEEPAMYLSVRPEILALIRARWAIREEMAMWRMVLDPRADLPDLGTGAVRLSPADREALQHLYADGQPGGEEPEFFTPSMLEHGVYYGVYQDEALAAAAGTHLVSLAESVAAIGNVYTRRDRRGRGLAACVIGAVAAELRQMGVRTIALNVSQRNAAALRVYEGLGFQRYCAFYEGMAVRESLVKGERTC